MPVRKMPGSGYEAGTGGRHSQAQAGVTNPLNKRKLLSFQGNCFPWCDCISYQEERRRQEMVELQQEMGIQVIKDGFILYKQFDKKQKTASFLVNNLTPKVSNHQQQQRQQPRNGVQQLLQAQQASLDQYPNHKNDMLLLLLGVGSSTRHPAPSLLCRPFGCFRAGWPPWRGSSLSGIVFTFPKIPENI